MIKMLPHQLQPIHLSVDFHTSTGLLTILWWSWSSPSCCPLHPDIRTVRLVCVCACVCTGMSNTRFCRFIQEHVHQKNLGFYLSACQRCPNYPNIPLVLASWFLPHPRITRQMHPPSLRPLATSPLTFFSPVIHFRWIYTVLLSSYNCHICVFGHFWNFPTSPFVQASDLFQRALYMCSEMGGCKKCWEMQLLIPLWKAFRCI